MDFNSILIFIAASSVIGLATSICKLLNDASQELLMLPHGLRVFFGAGFLIDRVLSIMPSG